MNETAIKSTLDSVFSWSFVEPLDKDGWSRCFIRYQELIRLAVEQNIHVRDVIPATLDWQGGLSYPDYTDNPETKEKVFLFIAKLKD